VPAPTKETIKENIIGVLKQKGLTKKEYNSEGKIIDTGEITEEMNLIIEAIAEGINKTWVNWQLSQTVVANVQVNITTGTGTTIPSAGNLP
jgi:hypothetical protein